MIQDLIFQPHNIKFRLERYYDPKAGTWIDAKLPDAYQGSELGPNLRAYIFMSYFQGRVTQNKIERILSAMAIPVSDSEICRILNRKLPELDEEHEQARRVALKKADFVQIDDTGARIQGSNGHTVVTSNPYFCSFLTSHSKSRITAVQALSGSRELKFLINRTSLQLLKGRLGKNHLKELARMQSPKLLSHEQLGLKLLRLEHLPRPLKEEVEMACAVAGYRAQKDGEGPSILVSDDAGNFKKIFRLHQLCWVHEFRRYKVLPTVGTYQETLIQDHLRKMRALYRKLKHYRRHPNVELRKEIESEFDLLFQADPPFRALKEQLSLTMKRKAGLLVVLEHPFVALHNNEAETDLRERVLKRVISYGNRSWAGVASWDRQLGLVHTCRKLGIGYWAFLRDRFAKKYEIPRLRRLVQAAA